MTEREKLQEELIEELDHYYLSKTIPTLDELAKVEELKSQLAELKEQEQNNKTIDELLKGCEHDGSYIPVNEVKRLMEEHRQQGMPTEEDFREEAYKRYTSNTEYVNSDKAIGFIKGAMYVLKKWKGEK